MIMTIDNATAVRDEEKSREEIDERVLGMIESIAPHNYFSRRDEVKALIWEYHAMGRIKYPHAHMLYGAVKSKSMEVGQKMQLGKPAERPVEQIPHYVPPHHQHHSAEGRVEIAVSYDPQDKKRMMRGLVAQLTRDTTIGFG